LPNSEILNQEGLNIPLHPNLSDQDVAYIIESIRNFPL
jgi:dTDP-4-amino-4,6-dideoxygalactose transaminase